MSEWARHSARQHPGCAMYDEIEGMLISITMQLRSAIQADADTPARVNGKVNGPSGPFRRGSGWVRQIVAELGSVLLETLGLAATIQWHLHQFQKCTGILHELTVNNAADFDLPGEYAATIFDIYSEALSNVVRHAGASRVAIALTITPHEVTLVVADNGIGIGNQAPASGAGGLAGMRARLQAHKGFFRVTGTRNAGTTVAASLPIVRAP
jgi:two-component system, NarL family, sensor histidine kinase UhpB